MISNTRKESFYYVTPPHTHTQFFCSVTVSCHGVSAWNEVGNSHGLSWSSCSSCSCCKHSPGRHQVCSQRLRSPVVVSQHPYMLRPSCASVARFYTKVRGGSRRLENSLAEIPQIGQGTTQEVACLAQPQRFWALNVSSAASRVSQNVWLSAVVSTNISFEMRFNESYCQESEQSEEFQQGKRAAIKRNMRTTSCQHAHVFSLSRICSFAYLHLHRTAENKAS